MRYQESLKGRNRVWSMLSLGVVGLLLSAISGSENPVFAQTGATNIAIGTTVQQPSVKRLGINLGGQTFYDSAQILRNVTFNNPGFEAEQWQSVLTCTAVSGNTCTDGNGWSQWPANFLQGGAFNFIYGKANGQAGTLVSMTKPSGNGGAGAWYNFGSVTPAVGDIFVIKKAFPGAPDAGWWPSVVGGATTYAETTDLSPNTPGQQALVMDASGGGRAYEYSYFDSTAGHSFLQMNGTYTISFRAKAVEGSSQLYVNVGRFTTAHGTTSNFSQTIQLTNQWQDYSYTFNADEDGTYIGTAYLSFEVSAGKIYLDDAALTESAAPSNPTPFRNAVVERLRSLNPGVLRYMDSGTDFGTSIDNQIAVPYARQRAGFGQGSSVENAIPMGLVEFLQLCQAVNAEPWFTMPMGMSPTEMQNLIQFLGGSSSTPYGAKRAALGQAAPWTTVFPSIHLELGDEAWNTAFSGDTIDSPYAYGARIATIYGAARSVSGYDPTKFDLIMNGWADVPWWNQVAMNNANNTYDTIDVAPYTFDTFTDYSSNEAIFGSMLAQPEAEDSRSSGMMYKQAQAVSGQGGGLTGKPANLAVYEVNLSTTAGTAPQSVLNQVVPSLGAGLSVAEHMLLMMRDDNVALQTLFCLPEYTNGFNNSNGSDESVPLWGTVIDMGGATNLSRPQFLAEQLANTAIGGTMLATVQTGTNPTWNENSKNDPGHPIVINGAHYLQSFAFTNGTSNSLIVFNLSRTASLPVTFSGLNAPTGTVQQGLLTASAITANNESTSQVALANSTIQNFNPSAVTTLPPYSMTVYQWSTAGGTQPTQPIATTTTLAATPTSVTAGQPVAMTATVVQSSGTTVPSGTVVLADNGVTIGTATLSNGQLSLNTTTLAVGSHALTASYEGSPTFAASVSQATTVTVVPAPLVPTSTAVIAPTQVVAGQATSLAATVTTATGTTPTGSTTFYVGSTNLGAVALNSGKATLAIPAVNMPAGTYSVIANYSGSATDSPSTSTSATLVVAAASTTTTVSAPSQVTAGQSATFTATVAAASGATPTGTVSFSAGSTILGTGTLSASKASLTLPSINLTAGTYPVTASYAATAADSASTSTAVNMTVASAVVGTTTTVTAPAQVTDGNSATFTATVAAASGATPTGTVSFSAGSTVLGTGTLSAGKATLILPSINLTPGTYPVTASYAATAADSASTSTAVNMTVASAVVGTTTTVTAPAQVTDGNSATFTATVAAASGATPTGTVSFSAGSTVLGTGTLSAGKATLTLPSINLTAGTYPVTASYAGTTTNSASTSAAVNMTVAGAVVGTTTTVTAPAQVTAGQSATFTATVAAASGATPTGTVSFSAGSTVLGTGTLSAGKATLTLPSINLTAGTYPVMASYAGTTTNSASTSPAVNMTVASAVVGTTTTVTAPAQVTDGNSATFTATVAAASGATPTGTVSFSAGSTVLGTGTLSSGKATLTLPSITLTAGTYPVTASYAGTTTNSASTSAAVNMKVSTAAVATTTTMTVSSTNLTIGQTVNATIKVSAASGATPTGTVDIYLGSTLIDTTTLSNGTATFTTTVAGPVGTFTAYAAYKGTSTDLASHSTMTTITISAAAAATTTTLTSSSTQATQGNPVTLSAAVVPQGKGATVGGAVTFYLGSTSLGSAQLVNGTAALTFNAQFAPGQYQLSAAYQGNATDLASKSNTVPLTLTQSVAATVTQLSSASTQLTTGQTTLLTSTVTAHNGATPTGSVNFFLGTTQLGTSALNNGVASFTLNASMAAGTYQLTAVYAGSTQDSTSSSAPLSITIAPSVVATTTSLTISASEVAPGQPFTLSAVVAQRTGTVVPQGTVTFYLGQTALGSATLSSGKASFAVTNSFASGAYQLTAVYAGSTSGNQQDSASTSAPIPLAVSNSLVATSTVLVASAPQITAGQGFSLTAAVSPQSGSVTPQGTVSFYLGQTRLGNASLVGGKATITIAGTQTIVAGSYPLSAVYMGSATNGGSSSTPIALTIASNIAATTTALVASSPNVTENQAFSLSAVVTAAAGGATPQGLVSFYLGQTEIGTATLISGKAFMTASNSFAPGTYALTAVYAGNGQDSGSTSLPLTLTIAAPSIAGPTATTTLLTAAASQISQGQTFSLTATVEPRTGSITPQGTVNFFLGQTQIGSVALTDGSATLAAAASFAPGTYPMTAIYAGNMQDSGSTSSTVTLTIASTDVPTPPVAPALATAIALTVNPQQPVAGQSMAFQLQVSAVGSTTPVNGSAVLYLGQTSLGNIVITGGVGMVTMQAPQAGTYSVSAVFSQQGDYLTSQTQPVTFSVEAPAAVQPVAPPAPPASSGTFTLGLSSSEVTIGRAQSASLQVMIASVQGYTGTVQLSCAGLPDGIACNFSPANLAVNAGNAASTLSLSAPTNIACNSPMVTNVAQCMLLPWDILGIVGFISGRKRLRGHWSLFAMLCLALLGSTVWMTGCGLTVNTVTRPYQVQVTAVGTNQVSQTTTLTLNVTQPAAQF